MDIEKWYQKRGSRFIWARGKNLAARYDLSGKKAEDQIKCCVESLATWGCSPTFPVPGRVLERHVDFIRHLEEFGAEIAVHGYNHVDLKACSPKQAAYQLLEAAQVFHKHGFVFHGFRCPYLSFTDELLDELPKGIFKYSSNKSIKWDLDISQPDYSSRIVETLDRFYTPQNASAEVCTPWMSSKLVEIPVCIPDDLQLLKMAINLVQLLQIAFVSALSIASYRSRSVCVCSGCCCANSRRSANTSITLRRLYNSSMSALVSARTLVPR